MSQGKSSQLLQRVLGCLIIIILSCHYGVAQPIIRGVVLDANQKPMPNASVLLTNSSDSVLIKGSLTDKTGMFLFANIPPGNYRVMSTGVGYKAVYTDSFEYDSKKEVQLPSIRLAEKQADLQAVTVTAKKPLFEQKMDRMVINVASSITGVGSTALDVLERSPGITVDRQNNSLSMNGKDGVVVMINDKISRMPMAALVQLLAGMSAGNIEKIELITTPPSKYDAEGNAGYINIVLKENTLFGTNGTYTATVGYGNGLSISPSLNFNHRTLKTNFFGDVSFSRNAIEQEFAFYRKVDKQGTQVESDIVSKRDPLVYFSNLRLGMDYQVNKKMVAGILFSAFDRRWTMDANNSSNIYLDHVLDTIVRIKNKEVHNLRNYSFNGNFIYNFSDREKISFDADYIFYKDDNPVDYNNYYFNGNDVSLYDQLTKSGKETPIKFWVSNMDYSRKLGRKVDLEAGIKGTVSRFKNNVSVQNYQQGSWIKDAELTANYNLEESIFAGYASVGISLNEKNNMKLGMRYERTNSTLNTEVQKGIVDRHYGNFFPTAFYSHKINDKNSFNLSYSRRITRPTFNDMAPFVIFVDPNTLFSGNPGLQPAISNDFKTDYLFKSFVLSFQYTLEQDPITNFSPKVDPITNKQTLAAENQDNRKTFNIIVSLPIRVTKWWNMQNNLFATSQELNAIYKGDPLVLKQKTFFGRSTQTFKLPKEFSMEVSGFFRSPGLFGIYKSNSFGVLDLGVQKKFGKMRSSLRLAYDNVLNSLKFKPSIDLPDQNLVVRARLQFSYPTIRLTWSQNFGNDKLKGKRNHSSGDDARERVQVN
jgi:hypothetical protein